MLGGDERGAGGTEDEMEGDRAPAASGRKRSRTQSARSSPKRIRAWRVPVKKPVAHLGDGEDPMLVEETGRSLAPAR
ncbi:MAG: hypothetical protein ACRDVW_04090 [Acidimicrobiales bacterium]